MLLFKVINVRGKEGDLPKTEGPQVRSFISPRVHQSQSSFVRKIDVSLHNYPFLHFAIPYYCSQFSSYLNVKYFKKKLTCKYADIE